MASSLTLRALKSSKPPMFGRTVTAFRTFSASSSRLEHYSDADLGTFKKVTAGPESSGRLVLVDFYANWCQPCHVLSPILKRISADANVKSGTGLPVDVMTINTESEDGMELGLRYKVCTCIMHHLA
jgi:thioredoxin 1